MNDLVLTLVVIGLVMTLEPLPVIGFILTLSTPRGRANGLGFIVGWVVTMGVIGVGVVVWNGGQGYVAGSGTSDLSYAVQLVSGLVLLTIWRFRQKRAPAPAASTPAGWMRRIDRLNPAGAVALGFLLQPWPLTAAGMAEILRADVGLTGSIVAAVLFIAVSISSQVAMLLFQVLAPARAHARLGALRTWLETHRSVAITILAGLVGAWLTVKGVVGLLH